MPGKVTTVLDIRELLRHLREGRSDRAIHQALGLGRPTISKYRRWAEQEGLLSGPLPALIELQARLKASRLAAPLKWLRCERFWAI
jgi:Homeodomain-like domain